MEKIKRGTWKSLDFIIQQIQRVMRDNKLDHLPSDPDLVLMGFSGLSGAIKKYHGGYHHIRKLLGQPQLVRRSGTWKDLDFVLQEARKIKRKHKFKRLPPAPTLYKLGYSTFFNAIRKYHDGIEAIREKLGEKRTRTPSALVQDKSYILQLAQKIMEKEGYSVLPGAHALNARGYSTFTNAVNNHYKGGLPAVRRKLSQTEVKKPNGYWRKWKNVRGTLLRLQEKLGHFPNQKELNKHGYFGIGIGIRLFGGMYAVKKKLGVEPQRKAPGYYSHEENIEKEIQAIIENHPELKGDLPSTVWLDGHGYSGLYGGILKMYGTYQKFREAFTPRKKGPSQKDQIEHLLSTYLKGRDFKDR